MYKVIAFLDRRGNPNFSNERYIRMLKGIVTIFNNAKKLTLNDKFCNGHLTIYSGMFCCYIINSQISSPVEQKLFHFFIYITQRKSR